jgi:hypothetical protein
MGISAFIKSICVQTAVYWGSPVNDGYGGKTYAAPVEIQCRWTDKQRIVFRQDGKQLLAKGEVLVTADLDLQGWLYLGNLVDFDDSVDISQPMNIEGAYEIQAIDKIPMIKSTDIFVRTIFL